MWPGSHAQLRAPGLDPEEQSGIEAGLDLTVGDRFTLQFTAFDQLASGLVQRVGIAPREPYTDRREHRRLPYALQNLGEIANRGWEVEAAAELGPVTVIGTAATVDSRVRQTASAYSGELRAGDRMLEVPRWTTSLSLTREIGPWSLALTAHRATDWINYDRLALARDFASADSIGGLIGDGLRSYWRRYDGATRLSASSSFELRPGLSFVLSADNLFDRQRGEPDNATIVPGRSLVVGVRWGGY
jgi:iron complex outermembrane receptor protein